MISGMPSEEDFWCLAVRLGRRVSIVNFWHPVGKLASKRRRIREGFCSKFSALGGQIGKLNEEDWGGFL
jgi:hypothetical protein